MHRQPFEDLRKRKMVLEFPIRDAPWGSGCQMLASALFFDTKMESVGGAGVGCLQGAGSSPGLTVAACMAY